MGAEVSASCSASSVDASAATSGVASAFSSVFGFSTSALESAVSVDWFSSAVASWASAAFSKSSFAF
jgi:hypothetical protein